MATPPAVLRFYALAESFSADRAAWDEVLDPEARFVEYPNMIAPRTRERNVDEALASMALGAKMLAAQRFELGRTLVDGDHCVVESRWTGTMAIDAGALSAGDVLTAHVCAVFELRAGRVLSVRNYDCYEPLARG